MNTGNNGPAGQPATGSGPGATAEATTPTIEQPDAALIALEQEHDQLDASIKGLPEDETDRRASRVMEMARELWELPAHTLHGAAAKLRVLRYHADQTEQEDYVRCSDTALEALDRLGDVNLILWEQEYNRLWNTDYKTETEAGQEALDRACEEWNGIYDKIVETLAHTPAGVAVKARMLRHSLRQGDNREKDNRAWDSCLASLASMAGTPTPAPSAQRLLVTTRPCSPSRLSATAFMKFGVSRVRHIPMPRAPCSIRSAAMSRYLTLSGPRLRRPKNGTM